ncbi:RNA methyltransferase [Nonomuraea glycinis]|jgi:TrmH family RNA methyltransferase|uniref:RNA methyltransferase n=1 Tax=Nonomuraea glycinis TaxID=2047744 RepID=A0A918E920_9ACTN|nr:RNA methyltransferase [Nonomuraea glycinis]MCA2181954.1 RNA methyltransferase [Nonomuraea glycinis]WSG66730.1 RNA methyltransferase [Nonomuraea glycinis]GGP15902.1 RNA methyltransferase [Nonomuraea glycinis]
MAGTELTNVRSPRVKAARRLTKRAYREQDRKFLAEGPQAVREALKLDGVTLELFATAEAELRHPELVTEATLQGVPVHRASGEVMAQLSQTVTPQGLLAVCRLVHVALDDALPAEPRLVAVLAHVRDPGNAGTVMRAADAAGADAVIFTDASVDPYNGKCVRASAGSLFHLPVVIGAPVARAVSLLRERGLRVLAADGAGKHTLDDVDLSGPTAWIFGNEAWGLPEEVLGQADEVVRVPIYGRAESLNLATAAAVCLYSSARAQRVS